MEQSVCTIEVKFGIVRVKLGGGAVKEVTKGNIGVACRAEVSSGSIVGLCGRYVEGIVGS